MVYPNRSLLFWSAFDPADAYSLMCVDVYSRDTMRDNDCVTCCHGFDIG